MQNLKDLTTMAVRPSSDPARPLTVVFMNPKPDEDGVRAKLEFDFALDDAENLATLIHTGLRLIRRGEWRT